MHGLAAMGTGWRRRGWNDTSGNLRGTEENRSAGMELNAEPVGFGGRMAKAVVTNRAQPHGQDVAKIVAHEFDAGQGFCFGAVVVGTIFPTKDDGVVCDGCDASIVDGGAGDVGAEVFDSRSAGTGGLDVDTPVLAPDLRINLPVLLLEQLTEVLTEGGLEVGEEEQEVRIFAADKVALGIEAGAGNQAVDVRMKLQALVPGVEDCGEAADSGTQSFVVGQFFGQGAHDGGEEQVIGLFGQGAKEVGAQLGWEGEGDQEVRRVDQFVEFALDPAVIGQCAALGAGFVIAGVIGEVNVRAVFAGKDIAAQSRGAATSDGPDGAALRRRKRRMGSKKLRQKTAQRAQDGGTLAHAKAGKKAWLGWEPFAELVHELQSFASALVGQMQVNHGGADLLVTEQFLDGVQMSTGFEQVGGETVAQ